MDFGALKSYTLSGQTVELQFEGGEARVELVAPGIVNVFAPLASPDHRSKAIEGDKTQPVPFQAERRADGLWIETDEVRVRVGDGFTVDFFDRDGNEVCMDYRGQRRPLERITPERAKLLIAEGHGAQLQEPARAFEVVKRLRDGEHFYGLGDKTGFLDKRGYEYEMWNTDNPDPQVDSFKALYKSIPFFMSLTDDHVYGIFLDNTFRSWFDMGKESEDYYWFGAAGGNLDYYYIAGDGLPQVLERYTYLTGACPLPQKWALGYHQSRWGYMTQEDVQAIADGMRDNGIPCDSIHFDIDYMQDYKVFTWNEGLYHGDPKAFLSSLAAQGFKPVVINDPGVKQEVGYPIYDEGVEQGYFAKTPEGEVYINAVWPGDAAYPDFGNPAVRKWWGAHEKFLVDLGVRGIWNDMNEPASFNGPLPDDVVFSDGARKTTHAEIHNVYGHFMAQAAYEGLKAADGRRPFVITRACYAGTQKYSTGWTGDNHSIWAHLQMAIPQLCNLGLSGMPFAGTDLGGFGSDTTPELLVRWVETACFSPLFRNHAALGSRPQEPWQFGAEVLDIYRKYVKLRYQWLPYFYDLFYEEERTGAPILRPLVFHYPDDETARTCNDQFMVGGQVLVAPVVQQGARRRMVYLPQGDWFDYWTGEKLAGPVWFIREAPLDVCPIYVKAGSVIPMAPAQSYVGEVEPDTLLLDVYPGQGVYDHYLDDGESFGYREGKYHRYRFTVREDGGVDTEIIHAGYDKPYREIKVLRHGGRSLMRYQNCIFDLYGTLVDIHTEEDSPRLWAYMADYYHSRGASWLPEELQAAYLHLIGELEGGASPAGDAHEAHPEIQIERVFQALYREKGVDADLELAVQTGLAFRRQSTEYIRLYDGAAELLRALRSSGRGVWLLSNAQAIFTRWELDELGLTPLFDGIYLSSDYGCKKPDPRFFEVLLQERAIQPETAVMVGNDGACDIRGAQAVGLSTVYIRSNISPREPLPQAGHVLEAMDLNRVKAILMEE